METVANAHAITGFWLQELGERSSKGLVPKAALQHSCSGYVRGVTPARSHVCGRTTLLTERYLPFISWPGVVLPVKEHRWSQAYAHAIAFQILNRCCRCSLPGTSRNSRTFFRAPWCRFLVLYPNQSPGCAAPCTCPSRVFTLTSEGNNGAITSQNVAALSLWRQPKIELVPPAAVTHCWFIMSLLSNATSKSFSHETFVYKCGLAPSLI